MKTKVSVLLLIAVLFVTTGCVPGRKVEGDGNVITQTINIPDYNEINVAGGAMKVNYTQSDTLPFLEVRMDQNIYEMYEFVVEDGYKLQIRPKKEYRHGINFRPTEFTINTHSTNLKKADLAGSSQFTVSSQLVAEEFKVNLAGSGSVHLQDTVKAEKIRMGIAGSASANLYYIVCSEFKGEIAGSGDIHLAGTAEKADFDIAGSGEVHGFDFIVADFTSTIAGSGEIDIHATNSLHVKGAGSGKINYKGNPQDVNSSIAGSGKLIHVD